MINHTVRILLIILFNFFLLSTICDAKELKEEDYLKSTNEAIERLQANPDSKKAKSNLKNTYNIAVKYYERKKNFVLVSNDKLKYSMAIVYYQQLNKLSDAIKGCPSCLEVVKNTNQYYEELNDLMKHAVRERYELGMSAMQTGSREGAREAYDHFLKCNEYLPGYLDVEDRIAEAMFSAILKVIIESNPVSNKDYDITSKFFYDNFQNFLYESNESEFVKFFSPELALKERIQFPNHIVEIRFDNFQVGDVRESVKTETIKNDSVVVEVAVDSLLSVGVADSLSVDSLDIVALDVEMSDSLVVQTEGDDADKRKRSGRKDAKEDEKEIEYMSVSADLTTNRKEIISRGIVVLRITDYRSKQILANRKFSGRFVWYSTWGHFDGDERALTQDQIDMCKREPLDPPPVQQLFVDLTKPIYSELTGYVTKFFSKY